MNITDLNKKIIKEFEQKFPFGLEDEYGTVKDFISSSIVQSILSYRDAVKVEDYKEECQCGIDTCNGQCSGGYNTAIRIIETKSKLFLGE